MIGYVGYVTTIMNGPRCEILLHCVEATLFKYFKHAHFLLSRSKRRNPTKKRSCILWQLAHKSLDSCSHFTKRTNPKGWSFFMKRIRLLFMNVYPTVHRYVPVHRKKSMKRAIALLVMKMRNFIL